MTYKHYLKSIHESYHEVQLKESVRDILQQVRGLSKEELGIAKKLADLIRRFWGGEIPEEVISDYLEGEIIGEHESAMADAMEALRKAGRMIRGEEPLDEDINISRVTLGTVIATIGGLIMSIPNPAIVVAGIVIAITGGTTFFSGFSDED